MKLLIFGIASNMLLGINSCDQRVDPVIYETFIYKNQSGYNISIETYKDGIKKNTNLEMLDSLEQKVELIFGSTENVIFYSDSLSIVFDDGKKLFLTISDPRDVNILNKDNYNYIKVENNHIFIYVLSDKDHSEAE